MNFRPGALWSAGAEKIAMSSLYSTSPILQCE